MNCSAAGPLPKVTVSVVSSCLRDAVDPSRSIPGGGDPGIMAQSSGGGVLDFGDPGIQFVELRRMTVPTRERKVFLGGGGVVDIVSRQFASDSDGLREKFGKENAGKNYR